MTTPAPIADTDGPTTPDLYCRVLRYVRIPDYRHGGRTVKPSMIKAVARELAEYAHWKTGDGAYPSVALIAVGAQVDYRTAQAALAALVHYRLIAVTRDNRGRRLPNEYRLLNPMTCGLTVLNPDQFRQAADAVQDKVKGQPTARPAPPEQNRESPPPQDTTSRDAEPPVTQMRDVQSQPPQQVPPSTTPTDHVAHIDHHRAREAREHPDPPADAKPPKRSRLRSVDPNHARALARARTEPRARLPQHSPTTLR